MILRIDRRVYSESCISKSIYALADRYTILRSIDGQGEILEVLPVGHEVGSEESVRKEIINTLNDFKLRCLIEEETKDIRTIIYAKAFADYTESSE